MAVRGWAVTANTPDPFACPPEHTRTVQCRDVTDTIINFATTLAIRGRVGTIHETKKKEKK